MMHLGSGEQGEFTFIDLLAMAGFLVGLQNLDLNLTQEDKQDLQHDLADKSQFLLSEIHAHLDTQDQKISKILQRLEEMPYETDRKNRRPDQ